MDVQLPDFDGLEATRMIREIEEAEGREDRIPIIALTAAAMTGDKERCLDAGCNDYLTKPIEQKRLRETLAKYLKTVER